MADKEESQHYARLTAGAVGAIIGGAAVLNKQRKPKPASTRSATRTASQPSRARHPRALAAERARDANPKAFKEYTQKARVSRKLSRLAGRAGAIGAVANIGGTIGAAKEVSKEGGSFTSRLGKFVEHVTGFPRGTTGAGLTEKEKEAQHRI